MPAIWTLLILLSYVNGSLFHGMSNRPPSLLPALLSSSRKPAAFTVRRCLGRVSPSASWQLNRRLEFHFIALFVRGSVNFSCAGHEQRIVAPAVLLISAGTQYTIAADANQPPVFHPVHFATPHHTSIPAPAWLIQEHPLPADLVRDFQKLHELWREGSRIAQAGAGASIHLILARLATGQARASLSTQEHGIQQVVDLLNQDPITTRSLTDLAQRAGMGRSAFARLFKQHTGQSPQQYRIQRRCELAADLMRSEGLNVSEAATATGYPDAFAFSKQFKTVMGYPPSEHPRARS